MANKNYDFCGWATRNNIRCSDGRTIRMDAFKENDGKIVPLVWNHKHDDPYNVLGHALLENRNDGVYAYCTFNDTDQGRNAKALVDHGDVSALSIYANQLKQKGGDVIHGMIREVSLVLAGANPGAKIETVVMHSDEDDSEELYVICEYADELEHSDADSEENIETEEEKPMEKKQETPVENEQVIEHAEEKEETVQDVIDTMNDKQKKVLYALVGAAMSGEENEENNEEDAEVKHNVFDNEVNEEKNVLSHSEMTEIIKNAKRSGSMKAAFEDAGIESINYLQHDGETPKYGVQNPYGIMGKASDQNSLGVDALFPDARNYTQTPQWISRNMEWVSKFLNAASHSPFSRVKTMFADITEDEARARGYIKGTLKKEEVFSLLKRVTEPTTIYKKQKMDRDDVIDITDFDVIAWIKAEMRVMLNEEIARAALIGDGRVSGTDGKIDETHIRPIYTDTDFFTIKTTVTAGADDNATAKNIIKAAVRSRKNYKGSGNPTLFTTEDTLTDMLMIEDTTGRVIYDTKEKLCNALRVSDIVTVELMENVSRTVSGTTKNLIGIIVNPRDYNFGADKGGAISMFDDFDIDYNQMKYLIETRCSGALVRPYSAIVLEMNAPAAQGGQS
ncbi:MAG: phage major capsid protein [Lachnospiraceae bacterium]|nr:phage major capsid protein [Lachnospiraceae bacterium]